jgi:hypothetical protein
LVRMALTDAERQRRMRERRARSIEEGEHVLRAAEDMLGPAIAETVAALDLGPEHAAAVKLAERYAKVIDRAQDVGYAARWIGPLLLDCLEQLGATPAARARLDKGPKQRPDGPNWLEEMRRARRTYPGA